MRYAALTRYDDLCAQLGVNARSLMGRHGLDVDALPRQDTWVPALAVARLLEASAAESGCETFGLRLAELRRSSSLGPLSMVLREESTVRSALDLLRRYERSYNEALRTSRTERDGTVTIRVALDFEADVQARQAVELALGATHRVLRDLIGEGWSAAAVFLPHPAPADRSEHERILGSRLTFDHDFAGLQVSSVNLDRAVPGADPQRRAYAEQFLRGLGPGDATTASQVRSAVEVLLPMGRCSVDAVAADLGVDRRTLHRHLAAEGETFSRVLDAVRTDLAERFLRNGLQSLTEVSESLGFAASSGLSRWFRQRYGCTPSEWRAAAGQLPVR